MGSPRLSTISSITRASKYIVDQPLYRLLVNFLSPFFRCAIERTRGTVRTNGARTRGKIEFTSGGRSARIFGNISRSVGEREREREIWRDGEMVTMSRVKSGEILSWQRLGLKSPLSALIPFPCASFRAIFFFKESVPKWASGRVDMQIKSLGKNQGIRRSVSACFSPQIN